MRLNLSIDLTQYFLPWKKTCLRSSMDQVDTLLMDEFDEIPEIDPEDLQLGVQFQPTAHVLWDIMGDITGKPC